MKDSVQLADGHFVVVVLPRAGSEVDKRALASEVANEARQIGYPLGKAVKYLPAGEECLESTDSKGLNVRACALAMEMEMVVLDGPLPSAPPPNKGRSPLSEVIAYNAWYDQTYHEQREQARERGLSRDISVGYFEFSSRQADL